MRKGFIFVLVFCYGCATAPSHRPQEKISLKQLCDQNHISWQWDSLSELVILKLNDTQAYLLMDTPAVLLEDELIALSGPIEIRKSVIVVPPDFQRKVIDQLLSGRGRAGNLSKRRIKSVIVDAGHGGKDPGAIGCSGTEEKEVTLDIAKRLKKNLEEYGFKVIMTRERDEFISLPERTEIAARSKADFFISIHANSSPVDSVHGIEVFSLRDLDYLERNEAQRQENYRLFFNQLAMKRDNENLKGIVADMLDNNKRAESDSLADRIAEDTSTFVNTKNRGTKLAGFYVLRNTLIPAILVEVGFLSNPHEEKLLNTSTYRQKFASALAKSILDYAEVQ